MRTQNKQKIIIIKHTQHNEFAGALRKFTNYT